MPIKETAEVLSIDSLFGDQFTIQEPVAPVQTEQQIGEQPRDEQGRFTKTDAIRRSLGIEDEPEPTQEATTEKVEEPQGVRIEIDLGEGAGREVFEAETAEALIEKMAEAKKHATLKIRELNQKLKSVSLSTKRAEPVKKLSADDEFLVSQELSTNPTKAFRKLFESEVGMTFEDFTAKLQQADSLAKEKAVHDAAQKFLSAHPDYVNNEANGGRLDKYVQFQGLDMSNPDDLETAYNDLMSSGLLETKKAEAQRETRIEKQPVPQKKAMSGIFTRSGSQQNVETKNNYMLSPEEQRMVERMSLDEAYAFLNKRMRSQK
jgi:hypothetical protein